MTVTAIPDSIKNQSRIREAFGDTTLDFLADMAMQGDPLADAVVRHFSESGPEEKYNLKFAIANGLESLDQPHESIGKLLQSAENLPAETDLDLVEHGSETYLSIGPVWLTIALGPGSLTHTYSSPVIATLLMKTGNFKDQARRRLAETALWSHQVARPNGLKIGAPGYVHSLQVRMLHAQVRAGLMKQGWKVREHGVPINQLDLARTWLDFTCVPINALAKLGINFTDGEERSFYRLWRLVAHYLGISEKLYGPVTNQTSAENLLERIDMSVGEPNQASIELTQVMLRMVAGIVQPALDLPDEIVLALISGLCRTFHGDHLADFLGIDKNEAGFIIAQVVEKNRLKREEMRKNPEIRQEIIEKTLAAFDAMDSRVEGDTRYQENLL